MKEELNKVGEYGYKGVNTVFTKPIFKIMFDIQNKPFLSGLGQWGETLVLEIPNSIVLTIRTIATKLKIARPSSSFCRVGDQGHLATYIKKGESTKKNDDEEDDGTMKRPVNKIIACMIEAIHGVTSRDTVNKNAIIVHIKCTQCMDKAFSAEVIPITVCKKSQEVKEVYKLSFTKKDMYKVDALHTYALVLTVNINTLMLKEC